MAKDIGPWTDLYSAGVIAYELLTGKVPFYDTETPVVVLMRQVNDPPPPPQSLNPSLDPAVCAWLERMLAKAPDRPLPQRRRGVGGARGDRHRPARRRAGAARRGCSCARPTPTRRSR